MPMQPDTDNRALVRPARAAQELDVSRSTIYAMLADGRLDAVELGAGPSPRGRMIRIRRADLDAFVAGRRVPGSSLGAARPAVGFEQEPVAGQAITPTSETT